MRNYTRLIWRWFAMLHAWGIAFDVAQAERRTDRAGKTARDAEERVTAWRRVAQDRRAVEDEAADAEFDLKQEAQAELMTVVL